ncbi:MAG: hypothetical protein RL538_531 [Candidatus Parcubacteria bacterium]|jgi:prepilin-type N-terminal cleavage/methylation domain-containing protein
MKSPSTQSGFSLVETLVAITILLLIITGPIAISSQSAKSSSFSSEQVTAFFLAQEGVELAQKARDDLLVRSFLAADGSPEKTPWANFSNPVGAYRNCYTVIGNSTIERCGLSIKSSDGSFNLSDIDVTNCSDIASCKLYRTGSNQRSRFTHTSSGGEETKFIRHITFERVNADEIKVISTVLWRSGSIQEDQSVVVESRLFNIYGDN